MNNYAGMTSFIVEYIQSRENDRLEKFDKDAAKAISLSDANDIEAELHQKRREEKARFEPANWLSDAARRASQIQLVTHGMKFIHSDAKGSSVYADDKVPSQYISTGSLSAIDVDVVGNAAALDVGKLLFLTDGTQTLYQCIKENDASPLAPLADNEEQLQAWMDGFRHVFQPKELAAHKLAKQIYWPLTTGEYHLLVPLSASSLTQALFKKVQYQRFSEESKHLRKLRKENQYAKESLQFFPNLAVQTFGGTKPQNISQLNSQRGGRSYLFSCAPPDWEQQTSPPFKCNSIFNHYFDRRVFSQVRALKHFLKAVHKTNTTAKIKEMQRKGLDDIVTLVLSLAGAIQNLPPGWSADDACTLPLAEKLWLDPKREAFDEDFFKARDNDEWQPEVANNFAVWMMKKLESKQLAFSAVEQRELRSVLEPELRLDIKALKEVVL